jgi:hypothetical protein
MNADKRGGARVLAFVVAAAAFGAAVIATVACEPGLNEAPAAATPKQRPPDRTEVTMEVSPVDAGAPSEPGPSRVASAAPATSTTPTTTTSDPLDDPNIGGRQEGAVEKAVAPIRPRLRACYKKALAAEPGIGGTATFDATIAKDGRVSSARFVKRDGLSEDMVGCLLVAIKAMTFEADKKTQVVTFSFGSAPSAAADAGLGDASVKR